MGSISKIEWTDATWNPVIGCSHVSPGCENCYAERLAMRYGWSKNPWGAQFAAENVVLKPHKLEEPLRWKEPKRIFVNSLSDLFHELIPNEYIAAVFGVMAACPRHTFQVLTKRPARMLAWFQWFEESAEAAKAFFGADTLEWRRWYLLAAAAIRQTGSGKFSSLASGATPWPLPNVWLGASVEDQRRYDERAGQLVQVPAAVYFLSAEPLLGPIDGGSFAWVKLPRRVQSDMPLWLSNIDESVIGAPLVAEPGVHTAYVNPHGAVSVNVRGRLLGIKPDEMEWCRKIDWVITGGESGGPPERRLVTQTGRTHGTLGAEVWMPKPEALDWVRSIRDQCRVMGVAFLHKQWGGPTAKSAGRLLDGCEWDEYPQAVTS